MCDQCDQTVIVEYKELVLGLFSLMLNRLHECEEAMTKVRLKREIERQELDMKMMQEVRMNEKVPKDPE